jgi:hypothetical protein
MILRASALMLAFMLVSLSGCGPAKLDITKEYTLSEPQIVILDAQPKPQKITVEFEGDSEVTVLLIKAADAPDDEAEFVDVKKAIAYKKGEKSGSFSGDVPENTATRVIARSVSPKAKVKLHITNK